MWIGFSPPIANSGLKLRDNGICVVDEEKVLFAISEERLSRVKHDNRISLSLKAWQQYTGAKIENINGAGISSCSDLPWTNKKIPSICSSLNLDNLPSHHYSHALSAFLLSPFSTSLILVADAGGNTFASTTNNKWWKEPREQNSLWLGVDNDIHLLERKYFQPTQIGFGEWYRAFTYFIGWHSHTLSGNTMALSAFGDNTKIHTDGLWNILKNKKKGLIQNTPMKPEQMVSDFLDYIGLGTVLPRESKLNIREVDKNLAAYIQESLVVEATKYLKQKIGTYGIHNLCLTGGVSQNCLMNTNIANDIGFESVYVSPFAGDVGQAVGNALYARMQDMGNAPIDSLDNTFLGIDYGAKVIDAELINANLDLISLSERGLIEKAISYLKDEKVIALFQGRSEFGPRALGHRSVIGIAKSEKVIKQIKKRVKRRAGFMPLAPVIHPSLAAELKSEIPLSNTMVHAPRIPKKNRPEFGYSLHIDDTARLQVATPGTLLFKLLDYLYNKSGERVIVNTSFNERGEPMVESPEDAVSAFLKLDIDAMIIGDRWVEKD